MASESAERWPRIICLWESEERGPEVTDMLTEFQEGSEVSSQFPRGETEGLRMFVGRM